MEQALVYGSVWVFLIVFLVWRYKRPNNINSGRTNTEHNVLHFKSNFAALEYSCLYLDNERSFITPAVIDQVWDKSDDGLMEVGVFLASASGPQLATTLVPKELALSKGDLVGCSVLSQRGKPFIMIDCKLKPDNDLTSDWWQVEAVFRKIA